MKKIKLAIADDYPVFRDGLLITLSKDEDLEVIIEANDGNELIEAMKQELPDIVIMDYKMPVMDGAEATRKIKEQFPSVKVLVISMYEDPKFRSHLAESGADGYLLKNAEPEEIRKAVRDLIPG